MVETTPVVEAKTEGVAVILTKNLIVDLLVMGTTPMGEAAEVIQTKGIWFSNYSVSNIVVPKKTLYFKIIFIYILKMNSLKSQMLRTDFNFQPHLNFPVKMIWKSLLKLKFCTFEIVENSSLYIWDILKYGNFK